MQGDRRQVELGDTHVLHDEGIYPYAIKFPDEGLRLRQFLIPEYGVQRHIDAHIIKVGIVHQLGNIFYRVGGSGTCAKLRRSDVHCICSMIHGLYATL